MAARLGLGLIGVLALLVVLKALAYFGAAPEDYGFPEQAPVYRMHRVGLLVHIAGGVLALAIVVLQLLLLQVRAPGAWHRRAGRVYALAVLAGGIAALSLSVLAWGGIANRVAFGLLAVLWLASTALAVQAIRRGDAAAHRLWITRSIALTLAGVTLRAEVGLMQLAGLSFDEAYQVAAWTCWVLNLVVVEWLRGRAPRPARGPQLGKYPQIDLASRNSSMPNTPNSRPLPEHL
jgi:uncharacterized membrane protein